MAFRHYTETYVNISPNVAATWTEYDLTADQIPASAVIEVAIRNNSSIARIGGVRATSGTLDRRVDITRGIAGDSFVTMHVQLDDERKFDYYAEDATGNIDFLILGYWVGCEYIEKFDDITTSTSTSWNQENLDTFGVSENQVVEVLMLNKDTIQARKNGVRRFGSSETQLYNIREASAGGRNGFSRFVQTSGSNASIDLYTQDTNDSEVFLLGYFNTPPGDYTDQGTLFGEPSTDATWESLNVSGSGISTNSVAEFILSQDVNDNQTIGVRNTLSTTDRFVLLEQISVTGRNYISMKVNIDNSGDIQHYASDVDPDNPEYFITHYWDNFTNSTESFSAQNLVDLFIKGRNPVAHYVEGTFSAFNTSPTDQWNEYSLLDNFNVPPSTEKDPVVAEIAIVNQNIVFSQSGGARSVGSSYDRKFDLHVANGGGVDVISILTPVSDSGTVELWGQSDTQSDFYVLGYWQGASYVEDKQEFQASATGVWETHDLGPEYANSVAEIIISNTDTVKQRSAGVRSVGSSDERRHDISTAWGDGGNDYVTMHVNTSGANGTIEIYGNITNVIFTVVGRWSFAPGTYHETFVETNSNTSNSIWEVLEISGAVSGNVAEIVVENRDSNSDWDFGVRESGSTQDRLFNLKQTTITDDDAADMYKVSVNLLDGTNAELRTASTTSPHRFMTIGYWDNLQTMPESSSGNIPLITAGMESYNSSQEVDYPSGLTLYMEGIPASLSGQIDLYMSGIPGSIIGTTDLYMFGINVFRTDSEFSADYPSGLLLYMNGFGILPASGQFDLFIAGQDNISASGDLFIEGFIPATSFSASGDLYTTSHDMVQASGDLFTTSVSSVSASGDLFISGSGAAVTPTSGTLARPLDWLLKTSDHNPQIIGTFELASSSVNIEVWDVTDGQNESMSLVSSGCYAIGNTGRWGWSTANLPANQGHAKHYYYIMTSDLMETFDGQFVLDLPERPKWIHPNSQDDYILGT